MSFLSSIQSALEITEEKDELMQERAVALTNMGSLYKLRYIVILKEQSQEKQFIDDLRCRNGNLEISCCRAAFNQETL